MQTVQVLHNRQMRLPNAWPNQVADRCPPQIVNEAIRYAGLPTRIAPGVVMVFDRLPVLVKDMLDNVLGLLLECFPVFSLAAPYCVQLRHQPELASLVVLGCMWV